MVYSVKLQSSGRILIPAEARRKLGLKPGQDMLLSDEDNELRLIGSRAAALARIQKRLRRYAPERVLSKELIAERRKEAARESRRG